MIEKIPTIIDKVSVFIKRKGLSDPNDCIALIQEMKNFIIEECKSQDINPDEYVNEYLEGVVMESLKDKPEIVSALNKALTYPTHGVKVCL